MIPLTESERAQIQADHVDFMTSTCRIGVRTGWVYDPATGAEAEQIAQPYYEGRCKVQAMDRRAVNPTTAGAQSVEVADYAITVPAEVTDPAPGHVVQVLTSPDPRNVRRFWVTGVTGNDFLSARYLTCTDNLDALKA